MARDELVTLCGYLIVGFMAAPLVMAVVGGIRDRRSVSRAAIDRPARDRNQPKPIRAPLQIVERSVGGYVRVTPLPIPSADRKVDSGRPSGNMRSGRRFFKGSRPR